MSIYELGVTDTSEVEFEFNTEKFTNLNTLDADANGEIQQVNGFSVFEGISELVTTDTFRFFVNQTFGNSYLHLYLHELSGDADVTLFEDVNEDGLFDSTIDNFLAGDIEFGSDSEAIAFYLPDNIGEDIFVPLVAEVRYFGFDEIIDYDLDITAVSTGAEQSPNPIVITDGVPVNLSGDVPGSFTPFIQGEGATTYLVDVATEGNVVGTVSTLFGNPILRAYADTSMNGIFDSDDELLGESTTGTLSVDMDSGVNFWQVVRPASDLFSFDYDLSLLLDSGFSGRLDEALDFDALQYLASYRDLITALGLDPSAAALHYETSGQLEERSSDLFDEVRYLASNGDLIAAFGDDFDLAVTHYISTGAFEGRATDTFNPIAYLDANSDLALAFGGDLFAATLHYIRFGFAEGRDPGSGGVDFDSRLDESLDFEPLQYLASYDDLLSGFGLNLAAATAHYTSVGLLEGRSSDLFDEVRYLASNEDLIIEIGEDYAAVTEHYIRVGSAEGRPTNAFDPVSYLNNNADLQSAFGNDLFAATQHYIQTGFGEGRMT